MTEPEQPTPEDMTVDLRAGLALATPAAIRRALWAEGRLRQFRDAMRDACRQFDLAGDPKYWRLSDEVARRVKEVLGD